MDAKTGARTLVMIAALATFGAALWLGVATQLGSSVSSNPQPEVTVDEATDASPSPSPTRSADPEPATPAPPVAAPAPAPSMPPQINGLHVLCPLRDGGTAHLLLTAETYYKAVTPEEVALLTEQFGPPVTTVDPNRLPPMSPLSVTEVLTGRMQ